MRIVIRGHPRDRMAERGILERDIRHVLENHEQSYPGNSNSIVYVGTVTDGRRLQVFVLKPGIVKDPVVIKSAAWKD